MDGGGQDGGLRGAFGNGNVVLKLKKLIRLVGTDRQLPKAFFPSDYLTDLANQRHYNAAYLPQMVSFLPETTLQLTQKPAQKEEHQHLSEGKYNPPDYYWKNDRTKMNALFCETVEVAGRGLNEFPEASTEATEALTEASANAVLGSKYFPALCSYTVQYSLNVNSYADLYLEVGTEKPW
ncbi:hypothetical protein R3P38DRAFT_2793014 [Favolaschia claudopus]|uniref:Uncharacterized protein n=1 Tax=Favolaschia claudopus TaxID=2862362 RepID=A0AAW0AD31_9AGAR